MSSTTSRYRCQACDAASYQRLTHRTADGAMGYSDLHRCSGCSLTFTSLQAWHGGADAADSANPAASPSEHPAPHRPATHMAR